MTALRMDSRLRHYNGKVRLEGPARVLIVDDNEAVADLLRMMLQNDFEVVGIAENGPQAILGSVETEPDAIILNCGIHDMLAPQVARWIKDAVPGVCIIAVGTSGESRVTWADATIERLNVSTVTALLQELL
jgi:two-component system chemotaxis response regulator CheY